MRGHVRDSAVSHMLRNWWSMTPSPRGADAIADGSLNTGTEIHFNPGHSVEKLHDMDPKSL